MTSFHKPFTLFDIPIWNPWTFNIILLICFYYFLFCHLPTNVFKIILTSSLKFDVFLSAQIWTYFSLSNCFVYFSHSLLVIVSFISPFISAVYLTMLCQFAIHVFFSNVHNPPLKFNVHSDQIRFCYPCLLLFCFSLCSPINYRLFKYVIFNIIVSISSIISYFLSSFPFKYVSLCAYLLNSCIFFK